MCAITRRYNRISPLEAKQEPFLWIVVNLRVDLRLKTSLYQLHDIQISCQFSLTFSEDFDIRFWLLVPCRFLTATAADTNLAKKVSYGVRQRVLNLRPIDDKLVQKVKLLLRRSIANLLLMSASLDELFHLIIAKKKFFFNELFLPSFLSHADASLFFLSSFDSKSRQNDTLDLACQHVLTLQSTCTFLVDWWNRQFWIIFR